MPRQTFRKRITNDELVEKINIKNKMLIENFLKEKDRKCSDKTIKGYQSDLNIFFTWVLLNCDNKYYPEIRKIELTSFFNFAVFELQWKSSRFDRMKSCLSGLSDYIIKYLDEEYPSFRNIIQTTIESLPKNPVRKKTILSKEQVDYLLDYLVKEVKKPQEALLIATAISSGMRIAEIALLTTDLIDENNLAFDDVFLETVEPIRTKGFGKEGHVIHKFIIKDLFLPYYKQWLPTREAIMKKNNRDHNQIFITSNGNPASESTFRSWLKKWEQYLDADIYFHAFRHYFVTYLSRLSLTSDFIVEIMGWKDSKMFKIYCDLTAKDKKWADTKKLQAFLDEELKNNME